MASRVTQTSAPNNSGDSAPSSSSPSPQTASLVKRLIEQVPTDEWPMYKVMAEAASTITRLTEENAILRAADWDAFNISAEELATLRSTITRLEQERNDAEESNARYHQKYNDEWLRAQKSEARIEVLEGAARALGEGKEIGPDAWGSVAVSRMALDALRSALSQTPEPFDEDAKGISHTRGAIQKVEPRPQTPDPQTGPTPAREQKGEPKNG